MIAWHFHPDVWLVLGSLWAAYELAVRGRATRRERLFFYSGLAALWVAADWPVHDLAEGYLYSVHMTQHLLISLIAAPLLLLGTPDVVLRRLLAPRAVFAAVRFASRPIIALVLFNSVIALTHVPAVVDVSTRSEIAHFAIHAVLFGAAMCMWLPVLNRLIELPALSYPGRMFYLFLMSLVPTVPASFLTFGHTVLYHFYETAPRLWGITAISDQRVAGLIMKLVGGFILWGVIAWYFFKWSSMEEREGVDVLEWHKVPSGAGR